MFWTFMWKRDLAEEHFIFSGPGPPCVSQFPVQIVVCISDYTVHQILIFSLFRRWIMLPFIHFGTLDRKMTMKGLKSFQEKLTDVLHTLRTISMTWYMRTGFSWLNASPLCLPIVHKSKRISCYRPTIVHLHRCSPFAVVCLLHCWDITFKTFAVLIAQCFTVFRKQKSRWECRNWISKDIWSLICDRTNRNSFASCYHWECRRTARLWKACGSVNRRKYPLCWFLKHWFLGISQGGT